MNRLRKGLVKGLYKRPLIFHGFIQLNNDWVLAQYSRAASGRGKRYIGLFKWKLHQNNPYSGWEDYFTIKRDRSKYSRKVVAIYGYYANDDLNWADRVTLDITLPNEDKNVEPAVETMVAAVANLLGETFRPARGGSYLTELLENVDEDA